MGSGPVLAIGSPCRLSSVSQLCVSSTVTYLTKASAHDQVGPYTRADLAGGSGEAGIGRRQVVETVYDKLRAVLTDHAIALKYRR